MARDRKIESREERDWSDKGPTKLIVIFSLISSYLRWCHWEKADKKDYMHCPGCTAQTVLVKGNLVTPDPLYCWQCQLSFWTLQGEKVPGIWLGQITVSLSPPAGSHLAVTHSVQVMLSIAMPSPPARELWLSSLLTSSYICPSSADKTPPHPSEEGAGLFSFLHWASWSYPEISFLYS